MKIHVLFWQRTPLLQAVVYNPLIFIAVLNKGSSSNHINASKASAKYLEI